MIKFNGKPFTPELFNTLFEENHKFIRNSLQQKSELKTVILTHHVPLNPMIRGWVNYYGKFRSSMLHKVFKFWNNRLVRWAGKKYKRYKTSIKPAYQWFERVKEQ